MARRSLLCLTFAASLLMPARALAQLDEPSWGITVGFAPLWRVPDQLANVFGATELDIKGHELRVGLVRGTTFGGEWGVALVHKRLSRESVVAIQQSHDSFSIVADDAEMLGVELHQFLTFARVGRAQIGVNVGGGLAQMRGFVTAASASPNTSVTAPIGFADLFTLSGREIKLFPLARAELAVAALVGDRVKVRVGSGFNMPGVQLVSVSVSALLGRD